MSIAVKFECVSVTRYLMATEILLEGDSPAAISGSMRLSVSNGTLDQSRMIFLPGQKYTLDIRRENSKRTRDEVSQEADSH